MARSTTRRRPASSGSAEADRLHHAVENLAVVDLDAIVAARDAELLQRVGGHHAEFGVGGGAGRADRVGVELQELAEAARARLLVAEHGAAAIGAIGLGQALEMFGEMAGERRGQVIAQRQPLLVVVLEGKHALVGPVLIGQEFSERVGIFDGRGLDRLEAVELVNPPDRAEHGVDGGDFVGAAIGEAARQARFDVGRFVVGGGGFVLRHDVGSVLAPLLGGGGVSDKCGKCLDKPCRRRSSRGLTRGRAPFSRKA